MVSVACLLRGSYQVRVASTAYSLQAYRLVREQFPLPSISLLNRIQRGGVDSIKALTLPRVHGEMSEDLILLVDEMILQKEESYQA